MVLHCAKRRYSACGSDQSLANMAQSRIGLLFLMAAVPFMSEAAEIEAPRITFDSTVFEFGRVKAGEVVKHVFNFTNIGKASLDILAVKPGCGCTTAGEWTKRLEPGKSGVIPLEFSSAAFSGDVDKIATVTCSDPLQTNIVLELKGTVWKPIEVIPSLAIFQVTEELQTKLTNVLRIISHFAEPVGLWNAESVNPAFEAVLRTNQPGKEYELQVVAVPPFTASYTAATITLRTSSESPLLTVQVGAALLPVLSVVPERLKLPAGPLKTPVTSFVTIRNNGTNKLAILDTRVDAEGAHADKQEIEPGRYFTVAAKFDAGFQLRPDQQVAVIVKTDHPRHEVIRVPVVQDDRAAAAHVGKK
jgi:hypothetical protein